MEMTQEWKNLLGTNAINWLVAEDRLFFYLLDNDFVLDEDLHTRMNHADIVADRYGGSSGISVEVGYNGGAGAGRNIVDGVYDVGGEKIVFTLPDDSSGVSKIVLGAWLLDAATDEDDTANIVPIGLYDTELIPAAAQVSLNVGSGIFNINAGI